jgi:multiple sugar transport system permease protein
LAHQVKSQSMDVQMKRVGIAFCVPAVILAAGLILYPLMNGMFVSFHEWNWVSGGMDSMMFTGISNYVRMLKDPYFGNAIKNTLLFTGISLAIEFALGLASALVLNSLTKGSLFFRTACMFPLMVSDMVAALIWKMLLNPSLGPVNGILTAIGLNSPNWLGDPNMVVKTLAVVDTWWQTGNITLILLAGLQTIPRDPIEMAQVDGANRWQLFSHLIWPHLVPFAKTAVLFRAVDLLRVFALPWGMTGGGPGRASETAQLYIYAQGLGRYLDIGYSTSLAITFSVIVIVIVSLLELWRKEPS